MTLWSIPILKSLPPSSVLFGMEHHEMRTLCGRKISPFSDAWKGTTFTSVEIGAGQKENICLWTREDRAKNQLRGPRSRCE